MIANKKVVVMIKTKRMTTMLSMVMETATMIM